MKNAEKEKRTLQKEIKNAGIGWKSVVRSAQDRAAWREQVEALCATGYNEDECAVQADVANREMSKWMLNIDYGGFTWLYIGTQDVWAIFIIVLYFSKYGNMKLGKPDDKPDLLQGVVRGLLSALDCSSLE
ncbi:hypothetical protein ACROYT_G032214 [Oculina patagonica]